MKLQFIYSKIFKLQQQQKKQQKRKKNPTITKKIKLKLKFINMLQPYTYEYICTHRISTYKTIHILLQFTF